MHVIDFEVFAHDWLCVIVNLNTKEETVIVNDRYQLERYHEKYKDEMFLGYNIRGYDQFIFKAILCGFNPKDVSDFIIERKLSGHRFSRMFRTIKLNFYDVMGDGFTSLKTLEGFMGEPVCESTVSFDIDRKLTAAEIAEVIEYCRHDVYQTIKVFAIRQEDYVSHLEVCKTFNLTKDAMGKTQTQLAALVLGAKKPYNERGDEFDFEIPKTLKLKKYQFIADWFINCREKALSDLKNGVSKKTVKEKFYAQKLKCDVAGVPHVFGWGGIHGAKPKYYETGYFVNVDVASYYPSLILAYSYESRNIQNPKLYGEIYHTRLEYKKAKNKLQAPYKLILNKTYGATKFPGSDLYDPRQANSICVSGMLLLVMLNEMLEDHFDIIQSNTDGILVRLRASNEEEADREYAKLDEICYDWERQTGMTLEFDEFYKVVQKDVNNYLVVPRGELYDKKGKPRWKCKGAYVKSLSELDYDLPIVNKALVDYFIKGIPIEKTIGDCDDLIEFQKIVKISNLYLQGVKNATFHDERVKTVDKRGKEITKWVKVWNRDGERLEDKTFRVFASKRASDGAIYKLKSEEKNPEKFANTPDGCYIDNGLVSGKKVPEHLDKQWYIDLAKERVKQFLGED